MLTFYGFKLHVDGVNETIVQGNNFDRASRNWVTRFNHNHLRITRIIRCLRVLGLEQQAAAFFIALEKVCKGNGQRISAKSREYWTKAATWPLYMRPDGDDEEGSGKGFLWDFEEYRRLRRNEQRDGYESGAIAPQVVVTAGNEDCPPALKNSHQDSIEGSDKSDGTAAKAEETKSSSENDSDAPAISTRFKKRKRTTSHGSP